MKWSILVAVVLVTCGMTAEAQQAVKLFRIGFLVGTREINSSSSNTAVLLQALRTLGYVEGKNLLVERRNAQGKVGSFPSLVTELVRLKPMSLSRRIRLQFEHLKAQPRRYPSS